MMIRVSDFCDKYCMLPPLSRVLCAVSGGADSMAMLHILLELSKKRDLFICCAHYNHCIRGEEAQRDEQFVRDECEKVGVMLRVGRGDVPAYAKENGLCLEDAARRLRYAFLETAADELSCSKIATAHNACDNAETVFMNLLRGSGLRGVCGIAPVRGRIIRPLLCLDRPEIEEYLAEHAHGHVEDSTNLSDDYSRNRLRHAVMEPLRSLYPDFGEKILSACQLMREDDECLYSQAQDFLDAQSRDISASALSALPKPIAARALMLLAPTAGRKHVEAMLDLAEGSKIHGSLSVPGMDFDKEYDILSFNGTTDEQLQEIIISMGETIETEKYLISCREDLAKQINDLETSLLCFKSEKIYGNIRISTRQTGDTLRQKNRGVTKSLKKLFSEARIPPSRRNNVVVLRDDVGVLGVLGFGEDERAAAMPGESAVIIEIKDKFVED